MEVLEAKQRVDVQRAIASGSLSATSSMSIPPCVESITSGFLAARSKTIEA